MHCTCREARTDTHSVTHTAHQDPCELAEKPTFRTKPANGQPVNKCKVRAGWALHVYSALCTIDTRAYMLHNSPFIHTHATFIIPGAGEGAFVVGVCWVVVREIVSELYGGLRPAVTSETFTSS